MLAVTGVQIVLEAQNLLLHFTPEISLGGYMGIRFFCDTLCVGVGILQNFILLRFRFMQKMSSRAAHFRIQTGDTSFSGLQFLQLVQGDGQLAIQFVVFSIQRFEFFGQEVYVLIHLGGGVPANGTGEFVISYLLWQQHSDPPNYLYLRATRRLRPRRVTVLAESMMYFP